MDTFDFNKKMNRALVFELATARWVTQHADALLLGPPGSGKGHVAQAIGFAVIQQGHRVVYREAHILVEDLAEAVSVVTLPSGSVIVVRFPCAPPDESRAEPKS